MPSALPSPETEDRSLCSGPRPSVATGSEFCSLPRLASSPSCHSCHHSFSPISPADKPADNGPIFPIISPEPTSALDHARGLCCVPSLSSLNLRCTRLCRPVSLSAFVLSGAEERSSVAHGSLTKPQNETRVPDPAASLQTAALPRRVLASRSLRSVFIFKIALKEVE